MMSRTISERHVFEMWPWPTSFLDLTSLRYAISIHLSAPASRLQCLHRFTSLPPPAFHSDRSCSTIADANTLSTEMGGTIPLAVLHSVRVSTNVCLVPSLTQDRRSVRPSLWQCANDSYSTYKPANPSSLPNAIVTSSSAFPHRQSNSIAPVGPTRTLQ